MFRCANKAQNAAHTRTTQRCTCFYTVQAIRVVTKGEANRLALLKNDLDRAIAGGGEQHVQLVSKRGDCVSVLDDEGNLGFAACDVSVPRQLWREWTQQTQSAWHTTRV